MAWAGHRTAPDFVVQGNILVIEQTVVAMQRAFTETRGMLSERMIRALEEGQKARGDSRGMQSAALLIFKKGAGYGGTGCYCEPEATRTNLTPRSSREHVVLHGESSIDTKKESSFPLTQTLCACGASERSIGFSDPAQILFFKLLEVE
jgi:uncharacterized Ntn-hydrolase superfamily protein